MEERLIETLNKLELTNIIIIEDELNTRIADEELLGLILSNTNRMIYFDLIDPELNVLFLEVINFISGFHFDEDQLYLLEIGDFNSCFGEKIDDFNSMKTFILEELKSKVYYDELTGLFTSVIVGLKPQVYGFLRKVNCKRIYTFKDVTETTQKYIEKILSINNPNDRSLIIVDKIMGEGSIAGDTFLKDNIDSFRNESFNILSLIYSSKANPIDEVSVEFFRHQQVQKTDFEGFIAAVVNSSKYLLFDWLNYNIEFSLKPIQDYIIGSPELLDSIIEQSINEGISNFEGIYEWYQRVAYTHHVENMVNSPRLNLQNFHKLAQIVKSEISSYDVQTDAEILDKMSKTNSYGIYNQYINNFFSSIESGDIFLNHNTGEYYMIIEQPCEMMVRNLKSISEVRRKIKKIGVVKGTISTAFMDKAVEVKQDSSNCCIVLNYFKDDQNKYNKIQFDLSETYYIEGFILDLCSLNMNGRSIFLDEKIEQSKEFHSDFFYQYINGVKEQLSELKGIYEAEHYDKDSHFNKLKKIVSDDVIGIFDFSVLENLVAYPIKRICRLKSEYINYVRTIYHSYNSRPGFNNFDYDMGDPCTISEIEITYFGKKEDLEIPARIRTIGKNKQSLSFNINELQKNVQDFRFSNTNMKVVLDKKNSYSTVGNIKLKYEEATNGLIKITIQPIITYEGKEQPKNINISDLSEIRSGYEEIGESVPAKTVSLKELIKDPVEHVGYKVSIVDLQLCVEKI